MNEYKTIESSDLEEFDEEINQLSKEGYSPLNLVVTSTPLEDGGFKFYYTQQWFKKVEREIKIPTYTQEEINAELLKTESSLKVEIVKEFRELLIKFNYNKALSIYDNQTTNNDKIIDADINGVKMSVQYLSATCNDKNREDVLKDLLNKFTICVNEGKIEHGMMSPCTQIQLTTLENEEDRYFLTLYCWSRYTQKELNDFLEEKGLRAKK